MADQIFRYAGPADQKALYGDPVVIPDTWQDWVKAVWVKQLEDTGYVPQHAPFVPTYEAGTVTWPGNDGTMQSAPLNEMHFPTKETANRLGELYGATVLDIPFFGLGPVNSAAIMRLLQFPNGATVDAYQLANYYSNNPEDKFPHVADSLCKMLIARVYTPPAA